MKDTKSDTRLVRGIIAGDELDFKIIYDRYKVKLHTYCLKFTKSEESVEEIVSEVFLKIWMYRRNLDPNRSFNALLYKMTKHFALNFLKKVFRLEALRQEFDYDFDEMDNRTEDKVIYDDYTHWADKAVDLLPPQQKRVFRMHRTEGMSYKEIANALNLSKGTIKNHIALSLKFLRKYLRTHTGLTFPE